MLCGKVIKGDGIGKTLGWPTANLDIRLANITESDGVYAGRAHHLSGTYNAAIIIDRTVQKFEVFLIDYAGPEIYGDQITVEILEGVSNIETFGGKALIHKIEQDIKQVKQILAQIE